MLAVNARQFLESTSIRGVGKVAKTQNNFLRRLWGLFVVVSSSLLFYSVAKITTEFLQYDVNIQTSLNIDDATPFPAVSICNNQPFSRRAYRFWASDKIPSPTNFNRKLRQRALQELNTTELSDAYRHVLAGGNGDDSRGLLHLRGRMAMMYALMMDTARSYYQSLPPDQAVLLGHTRKEAIVDCIFRYGQVQVQGTKGCIDDVITVNEFSHPNFFNCMTLQFKPMIWKEISSLTLIIWLGPNENYDIKHRQAFLFDVFEQAYGLRVAIHEPGTPPRILEQGMQTEPGKMNEVKYRPVRFIRESTPKHPCLNDEQQGRRHFRDLSMLYDYDLELCLNSKVQQVVMQRCGCMYIELPRVAMPNDSMPYCGRADSQLYARSRCLSDIDQRRIRKSFEATDCLPKCSELSFSKELSMTKWRDTEWMLFWIKEISERWNAFFGDISEAASNVSLFQKHLQRVQQYLRATNITDISNFTTNASAAFQFDDRYTFLVVKRESNNTMVKKEKIVLTLNALFSRIGGLCSMYIGLTLAFFVECIELVYKLLCESQNPSPTDNTATRAHGDAEEADGDPKSMEQRVELLQLVDAAKYANCDSSHLHSRAAAAAVR